MNEKIAEHIMSGKLLDYTGNWNHWRQVEEKVMEDEERMTRYMCIVCDNWCTPLHDGLMKADLRTRCIAALLSLPPEA